MSDISGIWGWVPLVGGLLLAAAMLWALTRNKAQSRREVERSERGAVELREQLEAEARAKEK